MKFTPAHPAHPLNPASPIYLGKSKYSSLSFNSYDDGMSVISIIIATILSLLVISIIIREVLREKPSLLTGITIFLGSITFIPIIFFGLAFPTDKLIKMEIDKYNAPKTINQQKINKSTSSIKDRNDLKKGDKFWILWGINGNVPMRFEVIEILSNGYVCDNLDGGLNERQFIAKFEIKKNKEFKFIR